MRLAAESIFMPRMVTQTPFGTKVRDLYLQSTVESFPHIIANFAQGKFLG